MAKSGSIKIEKVPLPSFRRKYPLKDLKVGESFWAPIAASSRPGMFASAMRYGIKITTRTEDGGLRVWRIG